MRPWQPRSDVANPNRPLARAALGGVAWVYLSYALGKLVTFATTVILARVLAVEDFGLVAFALIAVNYLDVVKDLGVSSALIVYPVESSRQNAVRSTAFMIMALAGVALTLATVLLAPLIATFFSEPRVVPITQVLALTLLISGFGRTHDALLQKDLGFRRKLYPDLAQSGAKAIVSVALAVAGFGAWSIVWGQVAGTAAATVVSWAVYPWRPSLSFDRPAAQHLVSFGGQLVAVNLLAAVFQNSDYLLIGRFLGTEPLGLYTMAYRVPDLLLINLCWVLSRVLFPVFARLQADRQSLRRAYLATVFYVGILVVPLGIGLFITAPTLVQTLLGEKWMPAVPVLQILAINSTLHALSFHAGDLFKALGLGGTMVRRMLISGAILVPAMLAGLFWFGLPGVAVSWCVVAVIEICIDLYILRRELGLRPTDVLRRLRAAVAAGAFMAVATWILAAAMPGPTWVVFVSQVVVGATAYVALLLGQDRSLLRQVWQVSRMATGSRPDHAPDAM